MWISCKLDARSRNSYSFTWPNVHSTSVYLWKHCVFLCDKVCQLFAAAGLWFYQLVPGSIFFNNKKYHYISIWKNFVKGAKNHLNFQKPSKIMGSNQVFISYTFCFLCKIIKNKPISINFYITLCRPDFTRTTKKRKSAIRSIEYTIKRNRNGKIRNKKAEFRFKVDKNQVWL